MRLKALTQRNERISGFTWVELFTCIAVIAIMFLVIGPAFMGTRSRTSATRIKCVNNLKNVGLAFRVYAADNNDLFPLTNFNTWPVDSKSLPLLWQTLSNELSIPKLLICPSDMKRKPADSFNNLTAINTSYFVNLDAEETLPMNFLAGDRNLDGVQRTNSLMVIQTNATNLFWTDDIHKNQGDIAMSDGSVQQLSNTRLRDHVEKMSGQQRLLIPE